MSGSLTEVAQKIADVRARAAKFGLRPHVIVQEADSEVWPVFSISGLNHAFATGCEAALRCAPQAAIE